MKNIEYSIDPNNAINKIERLMEQLKMNPSDKPKQESKYQSGLVDGLGNALAILLDESKGQEPREIQNKDSVIELNIPVEDQMSIPWEIWGDQALVKQA